MIPRLFIRTDASSRIGTGHVMRCLALAQAWKKRGGRAVFIGTMPEACERRVKQEGFECYLLSVAHPDPSDLKITLQTIRQTCPLIAEAPCWVTVDGYHFNTDYQNGLRKAGLRLLVIDDHRHQPDYAADIILNQNPGAEQLTYADHEPRYLLGTKYALLRDEFLAGPPPSRSRREPAHNILVSMGGADPENATLRILKGLSRTNLSDTEVRVLVGPANLQRSSLEQFRSQTRLKFKLLDPVLDMRPLMQWADLVVSAAGSTCLELAYFGLPMVLVILAENQKRVAAGLAEKKAALNLGWFQDLKDGAVADLLLKMIQDSTLREDHSRNSRALVDGLGRSRVVETMVPTRLRLRKAIEADCRLFWEWANESYVRAMSFHAEPILEQTHIQWFHDKLGSTEAVLWVAENEFGVPAGQIRFDKKMGETIVSLSIAPEFRGCGLGTQLIRLGCRQMVREYGVSMVTALIKKQNVVSQQAFSKAGFQIVEPPVKGAETAVIMRYTEGSEHASH